MWGKESFLLKKVSFPHVTNKNKPRENPRRGFSLFLCKAKKFTLSCVLGRKTMGLLAPNPRKFFEKNLTKNFRMLVCANIVRSIGQKINFLTSKSLKSIGKTADGIDDSVIYRFFSVDNAADVGSKLIGAHHKLHYRIGGGA